jgi:hypothetical protein
VWASYINHIEHGNCLAKPLGKWLTPPPSTMEPLLPAQHQSSISTAGRFLDGHSSRTPNKTHPKGFYTRSII